jgi:ribonuclease HII
MAVIGDKKLWIAERRCLFLKKFSHLLKNWYQQGTIEAGCDEAGRGCYAGPVFAAAVVLPDDFYHPLLNDSKQVCAEDRYALRSFIQEKAVDYAVGIVHEPEIDTLNILWASVKAMHLAVDQLSKKPQLLLIDGNRFKKYKRVPHQCIIKGDGLYASIAAASILAKTYRDDYMIQLHQSFPHYQWNSNKGYGTAVHRKAIEEHGACIHHRRSFNIFAAVQPSTTERADKIPVQ